MKGLARKRDLNRDPIIDVKKFQYNFLYSKERAYTSDDFETWVLESKLVSCMTDLIHKNRISVFVVTGNGNVLHDFFTQFRNKDIREENA
ncbi:hypothetical protein P5V15_015873 [Pogonomyrmex californicus]